MPLQQMHMLTKFQLIPLSGSAERLTGIFRKHPAGSNGQQRVVVVVRRIPRAPVLAKPSI